MRATILVIALGLALALPQMPAAATSDVHARNVAFLSLLVGEVDPKTIVSFPDGRTMTLAEAIDEAASRAGDMDLAALAAGSGSGSARYVGDIWLISFGPGACAPTVIAPGPPLSVPIHPQLTLRSGSLGRMSGYGNYVQVIDWTTKESAIWYGASWTITGVSDFFCFDFAGYHLALPMVLGVVDVAAT